MVNEKITVNENRKTMMEKKVEKAVTEALKDDARGPMFVVKKLNCEEEVIMKTKKAVEEIPRANMSLMCPMSPEAELVRMLEVKYAFNEEAVKKAIEIAKEKGAEFVIKALQIEDKI